MSRRSLSDRRSGCGIQDPAIRGRPEVAGDSAREKSPSAVWKVFSLLRCRSGFQWSGEELVSSHSDQRPDDFERHAVARFREGVDPGIRVSVVAVYERAIDVEDDSFEQPVTSVTAASSESTPRDRGGP